MIKCYKCGKETNKVASCFCLNTETNKIDMQFMCKDCLDKRYEKIKEILSDGESRN